MTFRSISRLTALAATALLTATAAHAAEPVRIVFTGGRMLPIEAVELKNGQFTVLTPQEGFTQGQTFAANLADHIFGDKPDGLNRGIALLLLDDPVKALGALEPVLASQKVTAGVQGNFWVEAARATVIAYAWMGNSAKAEALGKELSDATKASPDPAVTLGKALLQPVSTKIDTKLTAYNDLVNDTVPTDIAAYAAFYRAAVLKRGHRDAEALESYLSVPCLYPTGSSLVSGAAELAAADALLVQARREEATALLNSASRDARGTPIADEAQKRLEGLK